MTKPLSIILVIGMAFIYACSTKSEKTDSTPISKDWTELPLIEGAETPYLFTDSNGTVYLSWTERQDSVNHLKFATLTADMQWSTPKTIASGSDWFVNWADYPVIATNKGQNFLAHFLAKSSAGTYSYDINIKQSTDGAVDWREAYILHDDGKPAEHGFVSAVPYGENFFVSWLDGRNTAVSEGNDHHGGHGGGAMTVRAAVISPEGEKLNEWELDQRVCDCCQTTAAITANGPVVIYRDRSDKEIRDMSIVRLIEDKWTEPVAINHDEWNIEGCPVNGPRVSVVDNLMAVAWFSAAKGEAKVQVKFSTDGGATLSEPIRVDEGQAIGRVDVELIDPSTAWVTWMEGSEIKAAQVSTTEGVTQRYTIASSSQSRSSGFPQVTRSGNAMVFAWTDTEAKGIKTKITTM